MPKYSIIEKYRRKFQDYNKIANIGEIARRYFVMNSFDDVLMVLGILLASFFAGLFDKKIIITTVIGATIAATISGFWGAYLTEAAERKGQIKKLERDTLLRLKKSPIGKAHKFAVFVLAVVNSGADLIINIFIITPFLINIQIINAYLFSIIIAFLVLFCLGFFLGKITLQNTIRSGIKMLVMGALCAIIIFFVGKIIN